ncbi:pantoate--beta-alanine ligase [Legionella pneumophila]|uniref:Pantothenate synthetase n=1 Tax=Legionella pneumophila subsp. pascullei TaxID=91890 RepID=A0AAX2J025_LEGPN|nr:pantoate--beta-alanine ligase [Legionella pneumophila]AMP88783.1 pantothenate synthetase [Legionella pneumophila subsp. pascullei]AMP93600.1 pantoate--beta-alanine ligase [Legionella pneumophila subsp. pascullei]AMP96518.1 pantoate--beta-alanine ligase [Legionella pneumophila subsp. pascullei]SQG91551.1 pantoate--beta-alanine ligase [Legionella pneumophila subsp. pascullei]VEH08097.1 pantoate--beta-alanine ligase [Legionella pneumophila subsp. pascullei]
MQIFHNLNEWIRFRNTLSPDLSLGFAPTMGNLHAGHASLFLASSKENHYTASSLFVNPTQFNNPDDYTHYPRTLDADLELMTQNGVDFCILPNEDEIYADGYTYQVQESQLGQLMEGKHRPGHFNGVLTIVMKLFNLVKPNRAYFGEKDYQQLLLIQGMVRALFMNIEIKSCPTVREKSGLACSSRNNRLTLNQREIADKFAKIFHQNKSSAMITKELEALGITVEYIEEFQGRRFAAVKIGDIRLIDNYLI